MREVLTNIFALFYLANPRSPYGTDRAREMEKNRKLYDEKVKFFTKKYANPKKAVKTYEKGWDFTYN